MGFIFVLIGQGTEVHSALCIKWVVDRKAQNIFWVLLPAESKWAQGIWTCTILTYLVVADADKLEQ